MLTSLATRHTLDLGVMRDRNPDFVTLSDGAVRNGYTVSVMNRTDKSRDLYLDVTGLDFRNVKVIGLGDVRLPVSDRGRARQASLPPGASDRRQERISRRATRLLPFP